MILKYCRILYRGPISISAAFKRACRVQSAECRVRKAGNSWAWAKKKAAEIPSRLFLSINLQLCGNGAPV